MTYFQREVSTQPLSSLIDRTEDVDRPSEETASDAPKDEKPKKKTKIPREIRPANRNCTIPRKLKAQIPAGERGALALQFNRNGDVLAVAIQEVNDYVIQFFTVDGMRKFRSIRAHVDLIYELQWSPDDRLLMSVSADGMAKIWKGDGHRARPKQTLVHARYVYSGKFHPQLDLLVVTAGMDGIIRIWDRPGQTVVRELEGTRRE
jgi:jouberin